MDDYLPSLITLSGFLLPAGFLLVITRPLNLAVAAYLLVMAVLCLLGGLLFAAGTITVLQLEQAPPLGSSLLVLAGALISLIIRQLWHLRPKTN